MYANINFLIVITIITSYSSFLFSLLLQLISGGDGIGGDIMLLLLKNYL